MPEIIGVKQSVGALGHDTLQILSKRPPDFAVLAGDDAYIAPTIMMGGAGSIATAAHVCTPDFSLMIKAALDGDMATSAAGQPAEHFRSNDQALSVNLS